MTKHLLRLLPQHEVYVEVFGGSAALLFAKDPSPVEVYNDIDTRLVTFFRVLRDKEKSMELIRLLRNTPYSREEFDVSRELLQQEDRLSDVELAYRFLLVAVMARAGLVVRGQWSIPTIDPEGKEKPRHHVGDLRNAIRNLYWLRKRMQNVTVEHAHFENVVKWYDSPHTLFYMDPPYLVETRRCRKQAYTFDMDKEEHEKLLDIVQNVRGKVIISGYDSVLYKTRLSNWNKMEFHRRVYSATGLGDSWRPPVSVECVWTNFEPVNHQMTLFEEA